MIPRVHRRLSLNSASDARFSFGNWSGLLRQDGGAAAAARLRQGAAELHNDANVRLERPEILSRRRAPWQHDRCGKGASVSASRRSSGGSPNWRRRIGRKLVTRHSTGYRLTDFGEELRPYAERIEATVKDFERHVTDAARDRSGVIRVTCPEPIVQRMTPLIERFHARHPKLRVEFVMSDRYLDLAKGEADVAFRSGDTDDELVGRKIADSIWAVYASRGYIERHGKPEHVEDLSRHPLVSFDELMSNHRVVKWLKDVGA